MAATAVYTRVAGVRFTGSYEGGVGEYSNISATTAAFRITVPGLYRVSVKGSTFGTVALQTLGPDDTTWLPVNIETGTATVTAGTIAGTVAAFAADGTGLVYLSPGQYRWALA